MLAGRWAYNLITLASFTTIVAFISPAAFGIYTIASTFLILSDTFFADAVENLIVRQDGQTYLLDDGSFVELTRDRVRVHANADLELEAPGKTVVIRGARVDFQTG